MMNTNRTSTCIALCIVLGLLICNGVEAGELDICRNTCSAVPTDLWPYCCETHSTCCEEFADSCLHDCFPRVSAAGDVSAVEERPGMCCALYNLCCFRETSRIFSMKDNRPIEPQSIPMQHRFSTLPGGPVVNEHHPAVRRQNNVNVQQEPREIPRPAPAPKPAPPKPRNNNNRRPSNSNRPQPSRNTASFEGRNPTRNQENDRVSNRQRLEEPPKHRFNIKNKPVISDSNPKIEEIEKDKAPNRPSLLRKSNKPENPTNILTENKEETPEDQINDRTPKVLAPSGPKTLLRPLPVRPENPVTPESVPVEKESQSDTSDLINEPQKTTETENTEADEPNKSTGGRPLIRFGQSKNNDKPAADDSKKQKKESAPETEANPRRIGFFRKRPNAQNKQSEDSEKAHSNDSVKEEENTQTDSNKASKPKVSPIRKLKRVRTNSSRRTPQTENPPTPESENVNETPEIKVEATTLKPQRSAKRLPTLTENSRNKPNEKISTINDSERNSQVETKITETQTQAPVVRSRGRTRGRSSARTQETKVTSSDSVDTSKSARINTQARSRGQTQETTRQTSRRGRVISPAQTEKVNEETQTTQVKSRGQTQVASERVQVSRSRSRGNTQSSRRQTSSRTQEVTTEKTTIDKVAGTKNVRVSLLPRKPVTTTPSPITKEVNTESPEVAVTTASVLEQNTKETSLDAEVVTKETIKAVTEESTTETQETAPQPIIERKRKVINKGKIKRVKLVRVPSAKQLPAPQVTQETETKPEKSEDTKQTELPTTTSQPTKTEKLDETNEPPVQESSTDIPKTRQRTRQRTSSGTTSTRRSETSSKPRPTSSQTSSPQLTSRRRGRLTARQQLTADSAPTES